MMKQVQFGAEFAISQVAEMTQTILTALREAKEVSLDLGAVGRIDAAALQVLLAARKEAEALGVSLILSASEPVLAYASSLGVTL